MSQYNEYDLIQVIGKDYSTIGKYGLFLSYRENNDCRIEIDNTEFTVSLDAIKPLDESYIALDVDPHPHGEYGECWKIRTPCQKMGVDKEKIFGECFLASELFPFETFSEARQYIEENFKVIQIGRINAST